MGIDKKNFIDNETLKTYQEINGLDVIRELLLFKSHKVCEKKDNYLVVRKKDLDDIALILYRLKSNQTNKLSVSFYLEKFFHRSFLFVDKTFIKVPDDIYTQCKKIDDKYE